MDCEGRVSYPIEVIALFDAAEEMLDAHEAHKPCMLCSTADEEKLPELRRKWREWRKQSRERLRQALLDFEVVKRAGTGT